MSTQHPDNAAVPAFAAGPLMSPDDEIAEAYRAYAVLGCDEQLWDYDGKRTDGWISLPRAIPLCASLYSIGLPPELLGLAVLDDEDWGWLEATVPGFEDDLRDAATYLDAGGLRRLPVPVRESVAAAVAHLDPAEPELEHVALTGAIGACIRGGRSGSIAELVLRAGGIRHFLG